MGNEFTVGGVLSYGWDKMKENFLLYLCIILTMAGVNILGQALGEARFVGWIFAVAAIIACAILTLGTYGISLAIVDGKPAQYKDLLNQSSLLWDYLLASILYFLIVLGGLILLIVPGIIWAIKYQFYGYVIVDKKLNAMEAIKESGRITQGHKGRLFWLAIASIGVIILGVLCLLVGLFAAIPVIELAMAYTYRILSVKPTLTQSAPVAPVEPLVPVVAVDEKTPVVKAPARKPAPKKKAAAKKKR